MIHLQLQLVVEKTAITGIVTWSDLLKLPVQGKFKQLQEKNLAVSSIESAYLPFKAKALRDVIGRESTFQDELDSIVKLRDRLAHAKEVVHSSADLKRFVRQVELVEEWLDIFEARNGRQAATANSV